MAIPIFALADCNNFYVSGERGFRPSLVGRLVAVLSNNDGCIIARSEEAKALGFAMGDPYHLHHEQLTRHGVHVFNSNYALNGDMSRRVMDTLADHTPEIELYSIDEAFLNLAGFERRGLTEYARLIQATVRRHTGIPVSIGIGPTKTLAKVANHVAKTEPDAGGVYDLAAAGGLSLIVVAFTEKLANPQLAIAFLQHYPLNFTPWNGLPMSDERFALCAGTTELVVGLWTVFGLFPRVIIATAWIFINLTLTVFNWVELLGHLPLYGVMAVLLIWTPTEEDQRLWVRGMFGHDQGARAEQPPRQLT